MGKRLKQGVSIPGLAGNEGAISFQKLSFIGNFKTATEGMEDHDFYRFFFFTPIYPRCFDCLAGLVDAGRFTFGNPGARRWVPGTSKKERMHQVS